MKSSLKSKKCQPKIRMYSNAGPNVNVNRAEASSSLGLSKSFRLVHPPIFTQENLERADFDLVMGRPKEEGADKKEIRQSWSEVKVNVFIEYNPLAMHSVRKGKWELNRKGNIVTANLTLEELNHMLEEDRGKNKIINVQLGQAIKVPRPKVRRITGPKPFLGNRAAPSLGSAKVLIGIIDVDGFDFSHPDFLDADGNTRFLSIWDQGGSHRPPPKGRHFRYGAELSKQLMDEAIENAPKFNVPAFELEPQSQMYTGSHGTHVASIAAGNGGVCPTASIAAVLLDLPREDFDRRKSFYDSTRIADAVDYLLELSVQMDMPISINISLGTNGHAHDGSAPICRWIDSELKIPGRTVCVAAGNAGQEKGEFEEDMGYIMGRIHTSGRIPANGLEKDLEWIVEGDGIVDISENELEIWYSSQDRFAVSVKPPGQEWIGPVEPGQYIENQQLPDLSFISIYNELYNPSNGSNYLAVYLSPHMEDEKFVKGIPAGIWRIRLFGRQIRDGRFHGWIERDDPSRANGIALDRSAKWFFPSYFSPLSNVDNSSIGSLACGNEVVSVANLDEAKNDIHITSSQGPTRDERLKPDLAAPGTDILAANGFDHGEPWVRMTGTSMASPYVCGAIGLMFMAERNLTASQVLGILKCTARPLPGRDYNWGDRWGYGVIDIQASIEQAKKINEQTNITK